jgi:hypothetical protein
VLIIENVEYQRYLVTFRLSSGARRRWVRWAPAMVFAREAVARELVDRFGLDGIAPKSVSIRCQNRGSQPVGEA